MAALRTLVLLAMLLLTPTAPALAAGESFAVEASPAGVALTLVCPTGDPELAIAIDRSPVTPLSLERVGAAPPAIAVVLDRSAPMAQAGTPQSTRLRDAAQLAELLLGLAPADAAVALIVADTAPQVAAPLTTDRAATRDALVALAEAPPAGTGAPPLDQALHLAEEQLRGAEPGPRALVVFADEGRALAPATALPVSPVRALLVALGGAAAQDRSADPDQLSAAAEQTGAGYVRYAAGAIAELPALNRAVAQRLGLLVGPGERLRLTLPPAGPGPHLLTVEGCGDPLALAFAGETNTPFDARMIALGIAIAVGATTALWRRRRPVARTAPAPAQATTEARLLAAAAITTARRAGGPSGAGGMQAVVWDGRQRRVVRLEGRHWTIGSDAGCTIMVAGPGVAPLHARLSASGEGVTITALEAEAPLRIGAHGQQLALGVPAALEEGEPVMVGQWHRLIVERAWAGPCPP